MLPLSETDCNVSILEMLTEPVDAEIEIPLPVEMSVTPKFVSSTVPVAICVAPKNCDPVIRTTPILSI